MKKIYILATVLILGFLSACSEDSLEGLNGTYDMDRYLFTKAEVEPTEKLSKGIKALNIRLMNEDDIWFTLRLGSAEWILQEGVYVWTEEVVADKQYSATLLDIPNMTSSLLSPYITGGNLEITRVGETYFIVGLLEMNNGQSVKCDYKGKLSFEVGEDDPEASGYTISLSTSPVVTYDEMGNMTFHPGILKYSFMISDPDGNEAASFDAINDEEVSTPALAGTYTIQGNAAEPWLMDNGWVFPDWGMAGGSYYVDSEGNKQYITSGNILITATVGMEGDMLYSFSGNGLGTTTAAGDEGAGSFNIRFCTLSEE